MDRDKALQYFKQLGFTSEPLHVNGQRRYATPREMVVEGDGLITGNLWDIGAKESEEKFPPQVNRNAWTDSGALLPSSHGEGQKKKSDAAQVWTAISICSACTCSRNLRSPGSSPEIALDLDDDVADGSNDDSDEEDLSLDKLLQLMARQRKRAGSSASSTSLVRLATCFTPTDPLTNQHVNQLMTFLACDHTMVMETSLKILERLLMLNRGGEVVQHVELVDKVMGLALDKSQTLSTRIMAMGVLDKVLNVSELNYTHVRQQLDTEVYPSMLQCLHGKFPLEMKYAACCIVRTLARDEEFAARIKKESLFLLRQLQDASARLKEVYVGVLMALFAHPGLTEAGSVDTGVLPVLKGLLRDGPCETQKQALELLQCVMSDDRGVEVVAGDQRMVAYVLACLLSSKCRKVRTQACLVSKALTSLRKMSVARSVLEAVGHYVTSLDWKETDAGGGKMTYPVPAKNQADTLLWHNLDCFLDSLCGLLRSEGLVSMETDHLYCELPMKGEVSGVQLSCMSYLLQLVVNLCMWPLQRRVVGLGASQPARLDVSHLCDDFLLKDKYSALNHRLAVQQWKRFGPSVFAVLRWMSRRIGVHLDQSSATTNRLGVRNVQSARSSAPSRSSSVCPAKSPLLSSSRPSSALPGQAVPREALPEAEWALLHSLLNFVLCMTLVTCKRLEDPLSEDDAVEHFAPNGTSSTKRTPESSGLWVNANPHLTQSRQPAPSLDDMVRKQQEDVEKEAMSDRRGVRRGLYNEGLFELLAPLMQVAVPEVKTMCCLILRTAVQPLEEKAAGSKRSGKSDTAEPSSNSATTAPVHKRPQSAVGASSRNVEKQINIALHRMSPSTAAVVKDALGSRPHSACRAAPERTLSSAQRPPSALRAVSPKEGVNVCESPSPNSIPQNTGRKRCQSLPSLHPLVPGQPINKECQREAVLTCGSQVIQNLFSPNRRVKLYSLTLLGDLIRFTPVSVHMELSKCGVVPKLLDFIRVSDEEEQLETLALRVLGLLMLSDLRLQQLFGHHGGHMLLTALARNPNANIREQAKAALATVTKGPRFDGEGQKVRVQRPASAPLNRRGSCPAYVSSPPRDIWEHIMLRWAQEDQVVQVLQKFM